MEPTLHAEPSKGPAPLTVEFAASAGTRDAADSILTRWDLDGDGNWDTDWSEDLTQEATYRQVATTIVKAELDVGGKIVTVTVTVTTTEGAVPVANIDADTNRNGVIDPGDDLAGDRFDAVRGAILFTNLDDDNGDGDRDGKDSFFQGGADVDDLSPLTIRKMPGLTAEHRVELRTEPPAAANHTRIFTEEGEILLNLGQRFAELPVEDLRDLDLALRAESASGRGTSWDGDLRVTVTVLEGDVEVSTDTALLRAGPVIFPPHTLRGDVLYVMRIANPESKPNLRFVSALEEHLPNHITLYPVDELKYSADRWLQDNMQVGYQDHVSSSGLRSTTPTYLQTARENGLDRLEAFVPYELLDQDLGFAFTGGSPSSHNFGGNIEVAPPHPGYPFGRILIGGGEAGSLLGAPNSNGMNRPQRSWIDAQRIQGPAVELSSEWLAVGHIDEVFLAIPTPDAGGLGWKMVIASPDLALVALEELQALGEASATVFSGRDTYETTVDEILNDSSLLAFNEAAQARIDSIRLKLEMALQLDDNDFVEVPVLYEPRFKEGRDFAIAYNPGIQNLVVADNVLFIPDPEGPDSGGVDVWQQQVRSRLEPLGNLELHFVDVFESYHLLSGEAHCGTNFERIPFEAPWWEVEQ